MEKCVCTKCKTEKPSDLTNFPPNNRKKNKLDSWCRVCRATYRSEINRGKFRGQLSDDKVRELKEQKNATYVEAMNLRDQRITNI